MREEKLNHDSNQWLDAARRLRIRPESFADDGPERAADALDDLRAENERLRGFIEDFASWKFERIERRARDPQDDLDPLTDYLAVEAWQDDARAALAQKGGE